MLQCGVERLIFTGRLRVTLAPLLNELPIVAALQVRDSLSSIHQAPIMQHVMSCHDIIPLIMHLPGKWSQCLMV